MTCVFGVVTWAVKVGLVFLPKLAVTVILSDPAGELPVGCGGPGAGVTGPPLGC